MFLANVAGKDFDRGERKGIAEFAEESKSLNHQGIRYL
jgi:hypothetical protein